MDVTFSVCIFTSNTHIGSCFRLPLMRTTMDWARRSLDSSDDAFYSLPSSSHVSLNSATHDAERDTLRDSNVTILSRIKQSLTVPLGIFTHQQESNEKLEVPQDDGRCPEGGSNYGGGGGVLGSSAPTPRSLSRLEAGFVFDSASHTKLDSPGIVYRSDSPNFVSGWSNNTPLSFSDFTNPFGKPLECNNSPVSLDSTVPSPLFSVIGAHSTPPWSPTTPLEIHTRAQTCIDDRKRQSSVGSLHIKDNHGHHRAEGSKGKHAAPPLPFDTLIADISNDVPPAVDVAVNAEDSEEWWGLEYTLELSRRDSRASDSSSNHTGEHSKSRESWAAIHQGTVSPIFEDAEFQSWKKWHEQLDRVNIRKRRKRTIAFKDESKRLANLFVDELYAVRAIELYEHALDDAELANAVEWAEYACTRRPDPYHPPEQHRLAWVLKNHRSFASLRELKVLPRP